jgi:hypothetical protein
MLNNFSGFIASIVCILFWQFNFLLRSLKNSSDSKSMRVTSLSTCKENFNVDLLSKIVYYVISSTNIIKQIEKLVSCIYGAILHFGNVATVSSVEIHFR